MHADMWAERLREEPAFREAVDELWPFALGLVPEEQRPLLCEAIERDELEAIERGEHLDDLRPLWEEMTMVRRSVPGASW
jgi:1,2-phenylacetyl-CoA epoxidase catalytic subunit